MTREEIRAGVVQVIRGCCDEDKRQAISTNSRPVPDLGLESRDGVDFACDISAKLGVFIPYHVNPFVDEKKQARTVGQIVDLVYECAQQKKEPNHA